MAEQRKGRRIMSDTPEDNLIPEMERVAETLVPTRKKIAGTKDGEPAQSQILIRATKEDHELIKKAAEHEGKSMSEFVREVAVTKAREIVECQHPLSHRKTYPWAEFCLKCGKRLKDGDGFTYRTSKAVR
jgi:hypothetical protein